MKGHTRGFMSISRGIMHNKYSKQKLNTKKSTKTKVVGASNYIPWMVCAKRFLQHQSYEFKKKHMISRQRVSNEDKEKRKEIMRGKVKVYLHNLLLYKEFVN